MDGKTYAVNVQLGVANFFVIHNNKYFRSSQESRSSDNGPR